jgi:hypothetical protein
MTDFKIAQDVKTIELIFERRNADSLPSNQSKLLFTQYHQIGENNTDENQKFRPAF